MTSLHKFLLIREASVSVQTDYLSPPDPRRVGGYGPLQPTCRMERATISAQIPRSAYLQLLSTAASVTFLRRRWKVENIEIGYEGICIDLVRLAA